jgi:anti-sigma factor RsiW
MPDSGDTCSWILERIEPYVDGELSGAELESFEVHVESCETCRRELTRARMLTAELRALPRLRCPDRVVERAAARIAESGTGETGGREAAAETTTPAWFDRLRERFGGRSVPVLQPVAAAVLVVIVAALFVLFQGEQDPYRGTGELPAEIAALDISEEELELAKLDVMLAFAYVNKYNRRTAEIITQEGISDRVLETLERSVIDHAIPFPLDE